MMIARAAVPVASSSAALPELGPPAARVTVGGALSRSTADLLMVGGLTRTATTAPGEESCATMMTLRLMWHTCFCEVTWSPRDTLIPVICTEMISPLSRER